jgi:hypothetical protein
MLESSPANRFALPSPRRRLRLEAPRSRVGDLPAFLGALFAVLGLAAGLALFSNGG